MARFDLYGWLEAMPEDVSHASEEFAYPTPESVEKVEKILLGFLPVDGTDKKAKRTIAERVRDEFDALDHKSRAWIISLAKLEHPLIYTVTGHYLFAFRDHSCLILAGACRMNVGHVDMPVLQTNPRIKRAFVAV